MSSAAQRRPENIEIIVHHYLIIAGRGICFRLSKYFQLYVCTPFYIMLGLFLLYPTTLFGNFIPFLTTFLGRVSIGFYVQL